MKRGLFFQLQAAVPAWCLINLLFVYQAPLTYSQNCSSGDLASLQGFFNGLQSAIPGWGVNISSSPDCCGWPGVSCDTPSGRVIGLDLANMSLKGTVAANSLSGLGHLRRLNLSSNSLSGDIPAQLFGLTQLELLDLSLNRLTGTVPLSPRLDSIRLFNISGNLIGGSQPTFSSGSRNLVVFDISNNLFSGPIDAGICNNSTRIQVLRFSMNKFSGDFPIGFGNCSSLTKLAVDMNEITGNLPDDLFKLSSLTHLFIQGNELSGPLNPRISSLTDLVELDISLNGYSGAIPDAFGSLTKLESLSAESNVYTGVLPASLSKLSSLKVLNFRNNSLSGQIALDFSTLIQLRFLDLSLNSFTGPLPYNISHSPELMSLNLARNNLIGEIPDSFKNLTSLTFLSLSNNNFSNLSSALGILQNLPNLISFVLTRNFYGEMMPIKGIQGFEKTEVLVIANCDLSGSIPVWLANCTRLKVLDISWNRLNGGIPIWLGNLDFLFYMDLSNNSLTGEIPNSLAQMKSLISSSVLQQGSYTQNIPFFMKRNMSAKGLQYNQVNSFPPSLILSQNLLVGPILPGFGDLKELLVLDLSWNSLSGIIPEKLSGLTSLENLQLSKNNLTGSIPSSLNKLTFLSSFDVAYNNLSGPIPTGGQFSTFSSSDFEGNIDLCGFHLHPCPSETPSQSEGTQRKSKGATLGMAIGIGSGTAFLLTLLYVIVSRTLSKKQEVAKVVADAGESLASAGSSLVLHFQTKDNTELSIDDILKATNNFDQAYIVGCGGFGLVFKASLADGQKVAIKRLSGDFCQMEKEFQAEIETLSRAQHRNLVLLQGYCRVGNMRLLIYSYLENGSLDYWLHEKTDGRSILNWESRLKIAQGAARGLAYLHLSCEPHILHRDIKSSNILLDETFEAHLADFGLARLIFPYDTHVSTDLVGTLGYIPPEYGQASVATFKGDVYSFGVVLLELLTGRRPVDMCKPRGSRDLILWVFQKKKAEKDAEVFDPCIYDKKYDSQLMYVLDIACLCVSESPKLRPITQQIVEWLEKIAPKDS